MECYDLLSEFFEPVLANNIMQALSAILTAFFCTSAQTDKAEFSAAVNSNVGATRIDNLAPRA